jgi:hypothetical protein
MLGDKLPFHEKISRASGLASRKPEQIFSTKGESGE